MREIKKVLYRDLLDISVKENGEPFVSLDTSQVSCSNQWQMLNSWVSVPSGILVREWVYTKLIRANEILKSTNDSLEICVTYGYRSLGIQTKKFLEILKTKTDNFHEDPIALYEEVHKSIAVPSVAGHPTGGAVDVLIYNTKSKNFLDFGTQIYDFNGCDILNTNISKEAYGNRILLNEVMVESWFAPYYAEYWHFSYGDKEWAFYYNEFSAIYEQKNLKYLEEYAFEKHFQFIEQ